MKKPSFILFVLLLAMLYTPTLYAQKYLWGEWRSDPCFQGIQFRTLLANAKSYSDKYEWNIQFRNNYQKRVAFNWAMKSNQKELNEYAVEHGAENRQELKPGDQDSGLMWQLVNVSETVWVAVGNLRFLDEGVTDGVNSNYETCTEARNRGRVDYFCERKPEHGCQNFVKKVDTSSTVPETPQTVNKLPATRAYCNTLLDKYNSYDKEVDSDAKGIANGKQVVAIGQEILNRCKLKVPPDLAEQINDRVGSVKKFVTDVEKKNQTNTAKDDTNQNPALTAQSDAVKDELNADDLKRKIVENLRMNLKERSEKDTSGDTRSFSGLSIVENGDSLLLKVTETYLLYGGRRVEIFKYQISGPIANLRISDLILKGLPFRILSLGNDTCSDKTCSQTYIRDNITLNPLEVGSYTSFSFNYEGSEEDVNQLKKLIEQLKSISGKK